ncbi:MAG TPA: HesA/MoeB/ThiF family protein, partial [Chitinophagaceae bacterium]|nr:HesA/MoeB/ThiF family protein [Chitinophagaceae bacterium]
MSVSTSRYQRQMKLPHFGEAAQQALQQARILVVGAGGLGCPCLQYLVGAGVGQIGIADGDLVQESNLHRQLLYTLDDIGKQKSIQAAQHLARLHPDCQLMSYDHITVNNVEQILSNYDLVVDCSDNFPVRYLINDACVLTQTPWVFAAVYRYQMQLAVFNFKGSAQLRDVFPTTPQSTISCEEAGILGAVTGIVGSMQALEAIKIITQCAPPLHNQFLHIDLQTYQPFTIQLQASTQTNGPSSFQELQTWPYDFTCQTASSHDLTADEFLAMIQQANAQIIDVRMPDEVPQPKSFQAICIPLAILPQQLHQLDKSKPLLLFCHAGIRS